MTDKSRTYAAIHSLPDPELGDLEQHHADRCNGLPIFEEDGAGQFTARCAQGDYEVTGCETRREAGARFYGGEEPSLYGLVDIGALVDSLVAEARSLDAEIRRLEEKERTAGLGRLESSTLARLESLYGLLSRFVDPVTGELR